MVARPGRIQTTYTAGELDPHETDRTELKYYNTGAKHFENAKVHPQGGFSLRDGLRHKTGLYPTSGRLLPFKNSLGTAYEIALRDGHADVIDADGITDTVAVPLTTDQLPHVTNTHRQDTTFLFHQEVPSIRIVQATDSWQVDQLPYDGLPNYDYGASYSNGVPAEWEINFIGFDAGKRFRLTVSGQQTISITYSTDAGALAGLIEAAILELPNVAPGIVVSVLAGTNIKIIFSGTENQGDGWAVSGTPIDDADGAIPAFKLKTGIPPGEPIISNTRGWPRCGLFIQQRLLTGGFKSRASNWMASIIGRYFSFSTDLDEANGAFVVPLDSEGGETINHLVDAHNLLVLTSEREYWIADRTIDKTVPTNHVEASTNGCKEGVPVVKNEGASIYCHKSGSVLSEIRYTDIDSFVSSPITLLSSHLFEDVCDLAVRRAKRSTDTNTLGVIDERGRMRMGHLLREQDVTAFGRVTSYDALFRAVAVNARDEMSVISERSGSRRLERFERGLLLDAAHSFSFDAPQMDITGLDHLEGLNVWVLGDGNVYGPYIVTAARITVDVEVQSGEVGLFFPPKVETLPPPRDIGPRTVLRRKARIHSVWISVVDTTSLAVAVNGKDPVDVPLRTYDPDLEKPELEDGYTGLIELRGLTGYSDEPTVTITQLRPGRLTVRSITAEAKL
ncbi:hypothetical protein SAMN04515647_3802 [Cohaesibacter sp. ES.047]|uniref:hypothetical protein n=1 Tax=Cohaesibacter sp. ES.047 TaxID=1798205 RepID=UPI000BB97B6A|nr:hypothetical protein [Cohaesibacter sp. ES.047]SNY93505.1 hypothetical protein SAMN04515647_3802 [Cohaesibacter sp. ES.047]